MKRLPTVFIAVLLLALFLTGCSGIPAPPAAPIENEEAVDVAVEATLTAIAQSESEEGEAAPTSQPDTKTPETPDEAEPVSVSTPEPSEDISPSGLVLPPSVTDFAPAPRPASSKGDPDAPVVIYEWSDYTWPYCERFYNEVLPLLDEAYIKDGDVQIVYKEYPVVGGDVAYLGSLAGQCAGDQDQFFVMHDWLFNNVSTWRANDAPDVLKAAAADLGLDTEAFNACLDEQTLRDLIVEDYREGQVYGIRGTPNFVINGHLVQGLLPFEGMAVIIDALLEEAETGSLPEGVQTATPSPTPEPTPTPDTNFDEEPAATRGAADAPVTIVEFSDYQCPFCQRHFDQTMPQLVEEYIDTGKVRYTFKDFPLTSIHPQAVEASLAAECAGEQDAYWEMHDKLFSEQGRWNGQANSAESYSAFADEIGLDTATFDQCMEEERYAENISQNFQEGVDAGVTGTPAFFINGQFISGAQPFEVFQQIIDGLLAE